jgi:hypothetical protein
LPYSPRVPPAPPVPAPLAPRHRDVVRALAEALFAVDAKLHPLERVVDAFEDHLGRVSRSLRRMLLLALELVRWLPLLLFFAAAPFEALPVERRTALLGRMERSRALVVLMPLVAFKTLLSMIFYEDAGELRALGYGGDERVRWRRAR